MNKEKERTEKAAIRYCEEGCSKYYPELGFNTEKECVSRCLEICVYGNGDWDCLDDTDCWCKFWED